MVEVAAAKRRLPPFALSCLYNLVEELCLRFVAVFRELSEVGIKIPDADVGRDASTSARFLEGIGVIPRVRPLMLLKDYTYY
jgi:hypothetical protein